MKQEKIKRGCGMNRIIIAFLCFFAASSFLFGIAFAKFKYCEHKGYDYVKEEWNEKSI